MAEDDSDKTEDPTGKKLGEARGKGMVGKSQDFNAALSLLTAAYLIYLFKDKLVMGLKKVMVESFTSISRYETVPADLVGIVRDLFVGLLLLLLPILGGLAVVSVIASISQVGLLWTMEPLGPHFGRIFALSGLAKIFSWRSFIEIAKGVLKMAVVGVVGYKVVADHYPDYLLLADAGMGQFTRMLFSVSMEIVVKSTLVLLVIGVADLIWQKRTVKKDLRMSKQEVKDESRNAEGDPHVKGKIKSMRMRMYKSMMMKELPKATVVVTNPTFLAIAIRYDPGADPAPVVVAKGRRLIAERIRDVAKEKGIPIVEDKPLARGLYDMVEPGEEIPQEFFAAVAEILAYVYSLKGRRTV